MEGGRTACVLLSQRCLQAARVWHANVAGTDTQKSRCVGTIGSEPTMTVPDDAEEGSCWQAVGTAREPTLQGFLLLPTYVYREYIITCGGLITQLRPVGHSR